MSDIFAFIRIPPPFTIQVDSEWVCECVQRIHCFSYNVVFSLLLSCARAYGIVFVLFVKIVYCAKTMTITCLHFREIPNVDVLYCIITR